MPASEALRLFTALLNNAHDTSLPEETRIELLQRGIIAALEDLAALAPQDIKAGEEVDPDDQFSAAQLLYQAAAALPNEVVRWQAFQALIRLAQEGHQPAVDAIYRLAVEDDLLAARQILLTRNWQPSRPALRGLLDWFTSVSAGTAFPQSDLDWITRAYFEEASPALRRRLQTTAAQVGMENWARITSALLEIQAKEGASRSLPGLVTDYPSFTAEERQLMLTWLDILARQGSQDGRETICQLFIQHEDPAARQAALANGYAPEDPEQRALFYYLSEAWQRYDALDFNHNLIVNAYEHASRALRRRILEHSRYTGRMEWLRGHGSSGEVHWVGDLTDADWELSIERLSQANRFADLWRLAQAAPPVWSAAILDLLDQGGWLPEIQPDRDELPNLVALARESLANPMLAQPKKALHAPANTLNCLAIQPGGRRLAAGSSDQRIYVWDLPQGDLRVPPLTGPAAITRALAFSLDGELLAGASSDHRIRVFRLQGGQVIKTLEGHRAMIRALVLHPDGRNLYSAGFDGSIRFWRFPYGPEIKSIDPGSGEIFSLAISADGQFLLSGGTGGKVQVWLLPEGALVRELSGHADTVTHLAASPAGDLVASAGRDGKIRLWNFTSGGLVRTIENLPGPLTALALHPNEQTLIGGFSDGQIAVWGLSTGRVIDRLSGHTRMITGLIFSPTGDSLYSSEGEGKLQVWDLRTFLTARLPGEVARPGAAAALQERLKHPNLSKAEKAWLSFAAALARWRQRYDIELSEINPIPIGEFDIEIA